MQRSKIPGRSRWLKRSLIRDLTLRDGQQSQFATRMNQAQVDRLLPLTRRRASTPWRSGAAPSPTRSCATSTRTPGSAWRRSRPASARSSKLTALSRGRNLFGYNPYPDAVIEGFCRNAVRSGIDIMRIFDALNDIDNMKSTIRYVKQNGGIADCAVCYTVDPRFTLGDRLRAFLRGRPLPGKIFDIAYFVTKAEQLAGLGADMITIKDMAGLIDPKTRAELIRALKKNVGIPIDLHTHCTPGFGLASVLMAMVNGVDIVDTVILNFSGGPAAPAFELVQLFADKLGLDTGVDRESVAAINKDLREIRSELAQFDQYKMFPLAFDIASDKLPAEIDALFDRPIAAARGGRIDELLQATQAIEKHFNFPAPDDIVRVAQIPGGMYTNMLAQLQQAKLEHLKDKVLQHRAAGAPGRRRAAPGHADQPDRRRAGGQLRHRRDQRQALLHLQVHPVRQPGQGHLRQDPLPRRSRLPAEDRRHARGDPLRHLHATRSRTTRCWPSSATCTWPADEKEELLLELFPNVAAHFPEETAREGVPGRRRQERPEWRNPTPDQMWESLSDYA